MTAGTVDVDQVAVEEIVAEEGLPDVVHCTPLRGGTRVLPTKATATTGLLRWTWSRTGRKTMVDGARIRIGDRAADYGLEGGLTIDARGGLTLEASLAAILADPRM